MFLTFRQHQFEYRVFHSRLKIELSLGLTADSDYINVTPHDTD